MVVRGVPWDNLEHSLDSFRGKGKHQEEVAAAPEVEKAPHKFDFATDIVEVGRRITFGVVVGIERITKFVTFPIDQNFDFIATQCGSITGACFGIVEVVRDPAAMRGKRAMATSKVTRFTYLFAG
jgi:hypothetical protein